MSRVTKAFPHIPEEELRARLKKANNWRIQQKLLVIFNATVDPRPAKAIALHTGVAEQTVHNWISIYNRLGLEGIVGPGRGGRRKALMTKEEESRFLEPLFDRAGKGEITSVREIAEEIEAHVGHSIHHTSASRFLARNKWRRVMPRPFHPEADTEAQEEFKKKKFPEEVAKIVAERDPEDTRPVVIAPQDEGRFGRISHLRPCWAPEGLRPRVPKQLVRAFVHVYATVCAALGKMTALILPYVNTEMMNLFLEEVSRDFKNYFVIMPIDGASWHTSGSLRVPENIRLLPLPPYSPELNPVEHLWEDLREKAMPNKLFKSLDQVERALCDRLVTLGNDPDRLRSMTDFPYLRIT